MVRYAPEILAPTEGLPPCARQGLASLASHEKHSWAHFARLLYKARTLFMLHKGGKQRKQIMCSGPV